MPPSPREDLTSVNNLVPFARWILAAADAGDRLLGLQANIAALETRKGQLSAEVADLLLKTETHKQNGATLIAELESQRADIETAIRTQQEAFEAADAARKKALAQEQTDHERIKAQRTADLNDAVSALRRDIAQLTAQREGLRQDIDAAVAKLR